MSTIPRLLLDRVAATPDARAYVSWVDGRWKDFTWRDYADRARELGLGLLALGLARGDVVAILGATRAEWCFSDLGALGAGGVTVGLYPTLQSEGIGSMHYILEHSGAKFLIVESAATLKAKIGPIKDKLAGVTHIIVWDWDEAAAAFDPRVVSWASVVAKGRAAHEKDPTAWARACDLARPEELALLIYTSGTTGQPKGAMISHGNVWSLQVSIEGMLPKDDKGPGHTVSFLPMAHAAERCIAHYARLRQGTSTQFARSIETLLEDLAHAKPTRFGSVPRIFEKVHAKVQGELARATGVKGFIARTVYAGGIEATRARLRGQKPSLKARLLARVFDRKIGAPLRARFGGECTWFVSGAAPIAVDILELFEACGFQTYELYGLTETTGILSGNRFGALRYGTVGQAIACVELRIAADGEIQAKGPNVFLGYFKDPAATAEALVDGWFCTGDIGVLDADGYLKITDRKKNILVTAGGKNITPSNLENEVKNHPLVSYCHMHADKRAFPTALVCLDPDALKAFAIEKGLSSTTAAELKDHPLVRAEVQAAFDKANGAFAQFERIKKFAILPSEFSVDTGELTPTLKVKRKEVERKYADVLESLYGSAESL